MSMNEGKSLAIQSITQIAMRGISYVSILILLPSFISITAANRYADIVLISMIVSLAALFDGGYATSVLTSLSKYEMQSSRVIFQEVIKKSLTGSVLWSALLSLIFVIVWIAISPEISDLLYVIWLALLCILLSTVTTVSNTFGRILITKNFTLQTILVLLSGPFLSMVIIFLLRFFKIGEPVFIIFSFLIGGLFSICGALYKVQSMNFKYNSLEGLTKGVGYIEDLVEEKRRLWLFFSQIVSVLVVAKTPVLIRALCGNEALGFFSIFSAINAVIIAPVAAMQAPLLMKFSYYIRSKEYDRKSVLKLISYNSCVATLFGIFAILVIGMILNFFKSSLSSNFSYVNIEQLFIIMVSAVVYIFSVVTTVFINAMGKTKLILKMAATVFVFDTLLILMMINYAGALTPMLTLPIVNGVILFFLFVKIDCK